MSRNKNNNEEKEHKRNFIHFSRINLLMPLSCLVTLEIDFEWFDIGGKKEQKWVIFINRGMESSKEHPVGEKKIVYENRGVCEHDYLTIVNEIGFDKYNIITL